MSERRGRWGRPTPPGQWGARPLPVPREVQRPTGPRFLNQKRDVSESGPGEPPPGFVTATTSREEWVIYWALTKILGPPERGSWSYQSNLLGGRERAGGAVADFVITNRRPSLIIRVQTERFHIATEYEKQARDELQKASLERAGFRVLDVYAEHFMRSTNFETGQAAIAVVWDALKGIQRPNPITSRTSLAR